MTDQQILFHFDQARTQFGWKDEDLVFSTVAERMLDDNATPEQREGAMNRVRRVVSERDFNMFGG